MTKQEKIQSEWEKLIGNENYKQHKDKIQESGTICFIYQNRGQLGWNKILQEFYYNQNFKVINERWLIPKSLIGIENNNGWIRIENENDLPKEEYELYLVTGENYSVHHCIYHNEIKDNWLKMFTHYQPIIKPEKPLY